jgi:hypothetical protein
MQLNINELEAIVDVRVRGWKEDLEELQEKYNSNKKLLETLDKNYAEQGQRLIKALTTIRDLSNGVRTMGYDPADIIERGRSVVPDTSTGQPETGK